MSLYVIISMKPVFSKVRKGTVDFQNVQIQYLPETEGVSSPHIDYNI